MYPPIGENTNKGETTSPKHIFLVPADLADQRRN